MHAAPRLSAALLALLLTCVGCGGTELEPPSAGESTSVVGSASTTVAGVSRALRSASEGDPASQDALRALAAPGAEELLAEVGRNVGELGVVAVALRFVQTDGPLGAAEREDHPAGAFAVRVQVRYAYDGLDRRPAQVESRMVLAPGPGGGPPRVSGFGGGSGARTPLWLLGGLDVDRSGNDLVASASGAASDYLPLLATARAQVREVLPQWDGPLVVEVAGGSDQLEGAVAAPAGEYAAIAGLAATVDGSREPGAALRVYLNAPVFDTLSERGAQVVLTHEVTHVAVDAPLADMPVWLLEGFADYVALAGGDVPVYRAARQALERVREDGLPDGLPGAADLRPTAPDLGATYEEAWLVCRFLAAEHGEDALVELYRAVDGGTAPGTAFEQVLGTSEADFVQAWRADLAALAGVGR